MPGNDLTSLRNIIPTASTRQDQARADVTTILTGIINDIEPKVTPAGLDISSDLSFLSGGNYAAATNLGYLSMQNRAATPAVARSLYAQGGELYYRDGGGSDVQVTSSGALNAASLGGVTGGGYGSGGIELNWDGSDYNFFDGSGTYADVRMKELMLSNDTDQITIDVPGSLTPYTITLPSAVSGGASRMLQSDASGNTSWSNSLSEDLTLTGSADLKHGDRVKHIHCSSGFGYASSGTSEIDGFSFGVDFTGIWQATGTGDVFVFPLSMKQGDRIKSIKFFYSSVISTTSRFSLRSLDGTTGTDSTDDTQTDLAGASGSKSYTLTMSPSVTVSADNSYFAQYRTASASDLVYHIEVTYDRP